MPTGWVSKSKIQLALFATDINSIPMRILFFLVSFYAAFIVLFNTSASAQAPMWTSGMSNGNCAIHGQFTDYDITFKGEAGRLKMMTIRFRNPSFTGGGIMAVSVNGDQYTLQSRAKGSQYDASLITAPTLATKMLQTDSFTLSIGENSFPISTSGFDEAYANYAACAGTTAPVVAQNHRQLQETADLPPAIQMNDPVKLVAAPTEDVKNAPTPPVAEQKSKPNTSPLAMAMPMIIPSDYQFQFDRGVDPMAEIEWKNDGPWQMVLDNAVKPLGYHVSIDESIILIQGDAPKDNAVVEKEDIVITQGTDQPATESPSLTPMPSDVEGGAIRQAVPEWLAEKDKRVSTILNEWAMQEGVKANISLAQDAVVTSNVIIRGSFENAVTTLITQTLPNLPEAMILYGNGKVLRIGGNNATAMPALPAMTAKAGEDLRTLLAKWSRDHGTRFIWNSAEQYSVPKDMQFGPDYQNAVATLLNQFKTDAIRPVAQLNIDPETEQKTLIIQDVVKG